MFQYLSALARGDPPVSGEASAVVDHHAGGIDALVFKPVVDHPYTGNPVIAFIFLAVFRTNGEEQLARHHVAAPLVDVPHHGNQVRRGGFHYQSGILRRYAIQVSTRHHDAKVCQQGANQRGAVLLMGQQ